MVISGLEIEVVRKNNKNMHLYVLPPYGSVRVSAPMQIDEEAIRLFIITKMGWIKMQIAKFQNQPRQSERQYVSGESHYLWGYRYRLKVQYTKGANDLRIQADQIVLSVREGSTIAQRENVFNEWYRKALKEKIPAIWAEWQQRIDVQPNEWKVKNMRTKWGTCNVTDKRIWINLQLAKKPVECLEYIIVHELCHLLQKDHSAAFVALMNQYLPEWKATQKQLNDFVMDRYQEDNNVLS